MSRPKPPLHEDQASSRGGKTSWKPNTISLSDRVFNLVLASVLLAQGLFGFYAGRIELSPPKQRTPIVFQEGAAWLMAAAMTVGAMVLISVVLDHYDRRNNERSYQIFKWLSVRLGLCLLAASLSAHIYISLAR